MQASQTFKTRFSNFRKVVHQISSAATRNRKENLKTRILMYSIGGWTGRANIVWSANSISGNLDINSFPRNEYVLRSRILMTGKQERRIQLLMPFNFNSVYGVVYWHII